MDSILRQGSKGNAVAELQQLLQSKGFYSGKIDGDFGAATVNAVLKFQKDSGLISDGIVGSSSWIVLRKVAEPPSLQVNTALPTLLPGSKGAAVTQAQQLLKAKGYYQGRIDGDFGMGTRDAIASFQRANGLSVDGKVGEKTWQKLQAPAITNVPTSQPVITVEIVRPQSQVSVTPEPSKSNLPATTTPSIFVPVSSVSAGTVVANEQPSVPASSAIPSAIAISLVDAANAYSRAKLSNQTTAINNLQSNISPDILQQFFQRWQIASGLAVPATSLQDAFGGYNSGQMLNQNLALQWLQTQLLSSSLDRFRQEWANLTAGLGSSAAKPFMPPASSPVSLNTSKQLINLTDAIKAFDRTKFPNQIAALEKLQATLPAQTMQQFFQRWTFASEQNAIAISLLDVFKDYDGQKFPNQITALEWLEKELSVANLEQFSKDWFV